MFFSTSGARIRPSIIGTEVDLPGSISRRNCKVTFYYFMIDYENDNNLDIQEDGWNTQKLEHQILIV